MKTIQEVLEENKKWPKWCITITNMFNYGGHDLSKEVIANMLGYLCDETGSLKKYSDYLAGTRPKLYLAYQPSDDAFVYIKNPNDGEKERNQIAEFIVNHIL